MAVPPWMQVAIAAGDLGYARNTFTEMGCSHDEIVFHYNPTESGGSCGGVGSTLVMHMSHTHDWQEPD